MATVDVLRRGGIDVKLCNVEQTNKKPLTCANNIQIIPDLHINDIQGQQFDAIIIPGGKYSSDQSNIPILFDLF